MSKTTMLINEIFYSLQGEGRYTGTAAIFVRFAGCNLQCSFCDTAHNPYVDCSEDEVIKLVSQYKAQHVVLTGGEPTLQITQSLLDKLHQHDKFVAIETNGSIALDADTLSKIDWITLSPKTQKPVRIERYDELKVVYYGQEMTQYEAFAPTDPTCKYLQPCDTKDDIANQRNIAAAINYIKHNPQWKLSLQTHKILGIR